jgi:predicted hydrocarbon binding protein
MEAAQALLAPGDSLFYRSLGRDAGRMTAQTGVRHLIGSDPLGTARRAAFLWSSFYDTGRAEIVERRPDEIVFRIHDVPTPSRAWCERIVGWMQGCFDTMGLSDADISETECRLRGGRYCEVRMQWATPDPSAG